MTRDDSMPIISRGFSGRRRAQTLADRVPAGQFVTTDFPMLSAGPTPRISSGGWDFEVRRAVGRPRRWNWEEFRALSREEVTVDIHCVTK